MRDFAAYDIEDSGEILEEFEAETMSDAHKKAEKLLTDFWQNVADSEGHTMFIHYGVVQIQETPAPDSLSEFDDVPETEDVTLAVHPSLPCTAAEHVWDELRVVSSGGGVCTTSVCTECKATLVINTWAQDRFDGSEGHRTETIAAGAPEEEVDYS